MLSNFISRGARSAAHYQVNVSRPLSILKHGLSAVELEEELGRFPSVKLRGLPYNTSIDDLAEFLKGLNPIDIVVPKANDNGILGVLFSSTEDADAAMRRDKDSIGTRYIDVIRIPRVEYYRMAQDSISRDYGEDGNGLQALANMQGADEGSVVKMTGIPFQATAIDVQKFFDGFNLTAENIIIEARLDGKPSGNAYVRFSDSDEAINSLKFNNNYMGRRYVKLQVTKTEFAENCNRVR